MKSLRLGFLLLVLTLGGVCLFSCDKESEDEDGLGASRPIYEDYAQGYSNLNGTTWSETVNGVKTTLKCIQSECTFSFSNKSSVKYSYYFEYGNVYFTPSTGTGDKLRGVFTLMKDGRDIVDIFNNSKNVRLYILRREL